MSLLSCSEYLTYQNSFAGGCGKAELLEKKEFFSYDCFQIFRTDFFPDFFTHKFGVTFSQFLTLPKVCVTVATV